MAENTNIPPVQIITAAGQESPLQIELTHRPVKEAEALPLPRPYKVDASNIDAPLEFYNRFFEHVVDQEGGENTVNYTAPQNVIVRVKKNGATSATICLDYSIWAPFPGTVSGTISLSEYIKALNINLGTKVEANQFYSQEDLVRAIRRNRRFFASQAQYAELLASLRDLQIGTSEELKSKTEEKNGNKSYQFEQNHKWEANTREIELYLPILHGPYEPVSVPVSVNFEKKGNVVEFWLESIALRDLLVEKIDEEVRRVVASFTEQGVVVVWL